MNKPVVYKITSPSGRVYIGQSWNIKNRKATYAASRCKGQPLLYLSITKYGWANHEFNIVCELPTDVSQIVLNIYELFYYNQYKNCGYNMMNVREPSGSNGKLSNSTKEKLRESALTYFSSPNNRIKTSEATKKAMSDPNVKQKLRLAKLGKALSTDHILNIQNSLKGRKATQADYNNVLKAHQASVGRVQSKKEKEARAKKLWKKIEVDGVVYESIKQCCYIFNLCRVTIYNRLRDKRYSNWKYYTE